MEERKKKALELERKIINYNALEREVETNKRMLQIVLNRLKETSISSQIQTNNVRVQDLAEIPKNPVKPRKKLNVALAMIVGLVGGSMLAFFREYMDISLKDPNEIANLLQIPVLGSIPRIKPDGRAIKKKADIDRVVEKDAYSLASEAYRSIRTNLVFSINHSSSAKSIVITSSLPKEGKTLTAVNLAIMIANSGEKVLLVDADMRKPRIHSVFNDTNTLGLSQFLSGECDFDSIIKSGGIDNLYIVTSGKITHKPAELVASKQMKIFLENADSQFSKIIFDTPPIGLVTDAQLLASICTGVVLVTEGGKTTKDLLSRSKELLEKVDAKVLGVIVNNISLVEDIYPYPQYYYNKYYDPV
jgi:capsular exopolysaccharide synthesis family protein